MKTLLRLVSSSLVAGAVLVAGTGPLACSGEGSGTTGRRIALDVEIAASPESKQFTNAKGWTISITKAAIATGAFYFYDGETLFAGRSPGASPRAPGSFPRAPGGFVRSAFAHPGHYVPGNAKGELLVASSADLLAGGLLGHGDGVTGLVRSATFGFGAPASGPLAAELGASVIVLEGSATKGAATRVFRAEIAPDEVKDTKGVMQIEGCPFASTDMESDGKVTITVKLPMWFDQVELDGAPESPDGKPALLPDGLARNQLVRGAKVGLAYTFAYVPR
ncbi:MAG: hypothetical protein KF764_30580 [Labilithrix sp.]|nr:hypothetical protein [Labilithrix sp.]